MSNKSVKKMMERLNEGAGTDWRSSVAPSVEAKEGKLDISQIDQSKIRPKQKLKFTDLYTQESVYLENDIFTVLRALSKGKKGEKTRLVNDALREYFEKFLKDNSQEEELDI